jgi:hypothetical protein
VPTPASDTASTHTGQADLENLARALSAHGYRAALRTSSARPPFLHVVNPRATVLTERVQVGAGAFWFSWGERIATCDQVSTAASILARVLRTADGH